MDDDEEKRRRREIIAAAWDRVDRIDAMELHDDTPLSDPMDKWRREAAESDEREAAARRERQETERQIRAEQQETTEELISQSREFLLAVVGEALGEMMHDLTVEHSKTVAALELRVASLETEFNRCAFSRGEVEELPNPLM
jgi:hypothetical protein